MTAFRNGIKNLLPDSNGKFLKNIILPINRDESKPLYEFNNCRNPGLTEEFTKRQRSLSPKQSDDQEEKECIDKSEGKKEQQKSIIQTIKDAARKLEDLILKQINKDAYNNENQTCLITNMKKHIPSLAIKNSIISIKELSPNNIFIPFSTEEISMNECKNKKLKSSNLSIKKSSLQRLKNKLQKRYLFMKKKNLLPLQTYNSNKADESDSQIYKFVSISSQPKLIQRKNISKMNTLQFNRKILQKNNIKGCFTYTSKREFHNLNNKSNTTNNNDNNKFKHENNEESIKTDEIIDKSSTNENEFIKNINFEKSTENEFVLCKSQENKCDKKNKQLLPVRLTKEIKLIYTASPVLHANSTANKVNNLITNFSDVSLNSKVYKQRYLFNFDKKCQPLTSSMNVINSNSNLYMQHHSNGCISLVSSYYKSTKPFEEMRKEYSTVNIHCNSKINKGIPNEVIHSVLMEYFKDPDSLTNKSNDESRNIYKALKSNQEDNDYLQLQTNKTNNINLTNEKCKDKIKNYVLASNIINDNDKIKGSIKNITVLKNDAKYVSDSLKNVHILKVTINVSDKKNVSITPKQNVKFYSLKYSQENDKSKNFKLHNNLQKYNKPIITENETKKLTDVEKDYYKNTVARGFENINSSFIESITNVFNKKTYFKDFTEINYVIESKECNENIFKFLKIDEYERLTNLLNEQQSLSSHFLKQINKFKGKYLEYMTHKVSTIGNDSAEQKNKNMISLKNGNKVLDINEVKTINTTTSMSKLHNTKTTNPASYDVNYAYKFKINSLINKTFEQSKEKNNFVNYDFTMKSNAFDNNEQKSVQSVPASIKEESYFNKNSNINENTITVVSDEKNRKIKKDLLISIKNKVQNITENKQNPQILLQFIQNKVIYTVPKMKKERSKSAEISNTSELQEINKILKFNIKSENKSNENEIKTNSVKTNDKMLISPNSEVKDKNENKMQTKNLLEGDKIQNSNYCENNTELKAKNIFMTNNSNTLHKYAQDKMLISPNSEVKDKNENKIQTKNLLGDKIQNKNDCENNTELKARNIFMTNNSNTLHKYAQPSPDNKKESATLISTKSITVKERIDKFNKLDTYILQKINETVNNNDFGKTNLENIVLESKEQNKNDTKLGVSPLRIIAENKKDVKKLSSTSKNTNLFTINQNLHKNENYFTENTLFKQKYANKDKTESKSTVKIEKNATNIDSFSGGSRLPIKNNSTINITKIENELKTKLHPHEAIALKHKDYKYESSRENEIGKEGNENLLLTTNKKMMIKGNNLSDKQNKFKVSISVEKHNIKQRTGNDFQTDEMKDVKEKNLLNSFSQKDENTKKNMMQYNEKMKPFENQALKNTSSKKSEMEQIKAVTYDLHTEGYNSTEKNKKMLEIEKSLNKHTEKQQTQSFQNNMKSEGIIRNKTVEFNNKIGILELNKKTERTQTNNKSEKKIRDRMLELPEKIPDLSTKHNNELEDHKVNANCKMNSLLNMSQNAKTAMASLKDENNKQKLSLLSTLAKLSEKYQTPLKKDAVIYNRNLNNTLKTDMSSVKDVQRNKYDTVGFIYKEKANTKNIVAEENKKNKILQDKKKLIVKNKIKKLENVKKNYNKNVLKNKNLQEYLNETRSKQIVNKLVDDKIIKKEGALSANLMTQQKSLEKKFTINNVQHIKPSTNLNDKSSSESSTNIPVTILNMLFNSNNVIKSKNRYLQQNLIKSVSKDLNISSKQDVNKKKDKFQNDLNLKMVNITAKMPKKTNINNKNQTNLGTKSFKSIENSQHLKKMIEIKDNKPQLNDNTEKLLQDKVRLSSNFNDTNKSNSNVSKMNVLEVSKFNDTESKVNFNNDSIKYAIINLKKNRNEAWSNNLSSNLNREKSVDIAGEKNKQNNYITNNIKESLNYETKKVKSELKTVNKSFSYNRSKYDVDNENASNPINVFLKNLTQREQTKINETDNIKIVNEKYNYSSMKHNKEAIPINKNTTITMDKNIKIVNEKYNYSSMKHNKEAIPINKNTTITMDKNIKIVNEKYNSTKHNKEAVPINKNTSITLDKNDLLPKSITNNNENIKTNVVGDLINNLKNKTIEFFNKTTIMENFNTKPASVENSSTNNEIIKNTSSKVIDNTKLEENLNTNVNNSNNNVIENKKEMLQKNVTKIEKNIDEKLVTQPHQNSILKSEIETGSHITKIHGSKVNKQALSFPHYQSNVIKKITYTKNQKKAMKEIPIKSKSELNKINLKKSTNNNKKVVLENNKLQINITKGTLQIKSHDKIKNNVVTNLKQSDKAVSREEIQNKKVVGILTKEKSTKNNSAKKPEIKSKDLQKNGIKRLIYLHTEGGKYLQNAVSATKTEMQSKIPKLMKSENQTSKTNNSNFNNKNGNNLNVNKRPSVQKVNQGKKNKNSNHQSFKKKHPFNIIPKKSQYNDGIVIKKKDLKFQREIVKHFKLHNKLTASPLKQNNIKRSVSDYDNIDKWDDNNNNNDSKAIRVMDMRSLPSFKKYRSRPFEQVFQHSSVVNIDPEHDIFYNDNRNKSNQFKYQIKSRDGWSNNYHSYNEWNLKNNRNVLNYSDYMLFSYIKKDRINKKTLSQMKQNISHNTLVEKINSQSKRNLEHVKISPTYMEKIPYLKNKVSGYFTTQKVKNQQKKTHSVSSKVKNDIPPKRTSTQEYFIKKNKSTLNIKSSPLKLNFSSPNNLSSTSYHSLLNY